MANMESDQVFQRYRQLAAELYEAGASPTDLSAGLGQRRVSRCDKSHIVPHVELLW